VDEFIALYFTAKDKSQLNLIDKQKFIETSLYLKSKLTEKDLAYLFTLIDINDSGTITKSEFLLLLGEPDIRVERNKGNVDLPNELTKEIQDLFKEVDTDNSGFVEKNELAQSLMRVGINPTNQEIDEYLAKFDKDGDGKISYGEFKYIFEDKLKSDMMVMDELLGNLRREFKNADIQRNRMLNMTQL
jgi:Ca2+-binding EF-hand superfamily protein